jgi:OOP family OmpA-OmpF porin
MYQRIKSLLAAIVVTGILSPGFAQEVSKRDVDGDGIKNKFDKCPSTPPGVKVDGTGCPIDTDKDGVADYLDQCPAVPGSAAMNGCQDKDKDSVADNEDLCPDVPGMARFKGCPDSDKDGIEDSKDKCPNAYGSDRFQGCPDSDGDGVQDANDKCPDTQSGVKVDETGCPADADRDGISDIDDKCPDTKAGTKVDAKGCPADTDGDGIIDSQDKCPTTPGVAADSGCPVVKTPPPPPKRMNFATRKINFDNGSAVIKASSYAMLDEVVNILKEYPDYNARINGFTDAVEKTPTTLSQSRAEAVKTYLLGKNVPGNRIEAAGFGKTRPVAANTTVGRTQNRRVEIELYLR